MSTTWSKTLLVTAMALAGSASAADCSAVATVVAKKLQDGYVIETTATKLSQLLTSEDFLQRCRQQKSADSIADFMTTELNKIANDKHLSVHYDPQWVKELKEYRASDQETAFADKRVLEKPSDNYGFKQVEMLEGNIGYVDIRSFADSHLGGATLESAMKFLQHADGIIIDLRHNFGGSPFMINTLASYFFDLDTVHLSTFESRGSGQITQTQEWTSPYVPGPRFKDAPLYILTSQNSASAAEAFSYAMKNLGRATLVGEVTAGAGHGRNTEIVNDDYILSLPTTRGVDPRTNDSWEGKGVKPNIETPSDNALNVAYADVLKTLINKGSQNSKLQQWAYPTAKAKSSQYVVDQEDIKRLVGEYGERKIYQKSGKLFYQHADDRPFEIELLDQETIIFKAFASARLQALYKNNQVVAVKMLSFDEEAKEFKRTK